MLSRVVVAIALVATPMAPAATRARASAAPMTVQLRSATTGVPVEEPGFSVTVQPPAARPGDAVALTFTSLSPGVRIVDCIAFFPETIGDTCRRSPEGDVVRTRVPANLPPGATLLRWGVSSVSATGRKGVADDAIPYVVLPPASGQAAGATDAPVVPAFAVVAQPAAAAGGAEVTVSNSSEDTGISITDCRVGFAEDALVDCRRSPSGWTARVEVPPTMPTGPNPLHWTIAFARSDGPDGTARGLASFRVQPPASPRTQPPASSGTRPPASSGKVPPGSSSALPPDQPGRDWWDIARSPIWWTTLGGVLLAALLAFHIVRRPILDRRRPRPTAAGPDVRRTTAARRDERRTTGAQDHEATISVIPVPAPEQMSVRIDRPDAPPARDIRLRIRRPRLAPHVPEDLP